MAQGKNKPDLSDLKARLGLKKGGAPEEEKAQPASQGQGAESDGPGPGPAPSGPPQGGPPSGGPPSGGPPQAGRPSGGPPPAASGPPQQSSSGPPGAAQAPPAASQGPPAGAPAAAASGRQQTGSPSQPGQHAQRQPQQQQQQQRIDEPSRSAAASSPAFDDIDLDDEDMKAAGGSTFSPATVILMVVLLGIGISFGWVASNTLQNREVYNARSDDAARIHQALQPTVDNVDEAREIVDGLSPEKPDFEATEKLASIDLSVGGNVLGGNRLLLGPEIVDLVTNFLVDTAMLNQMIKEHHRLTTKVDREEIEQLMEDNEVLEQDRFGVLFDYDHLAQRSGSEDYFPKMGRLVTVPEMETDDEGKLEVQLLNSDRTIKTKVQGLLPLDKGDILKTSGENAMQRYQRRIAGIQRQMLKYDQYKKAMMTRLEEMGSKEPAALLNF